MVGVVQTPHSMLAQKAKPVGKIDKSVLNLIEEMKQTLLTSKNPKGVGLAAPQIAKSVRIFITRPNQKSPIDIFINPEIIRMGEELTEGVPRKSNKFEGCLSIPNIWGIVHRAKKIKVRYQTLDFDPKTNDQRLKTKTQTFSGFLATIIQHEVDHLNGILFTQRVLEQKEKFYKVVTDEKGEEIFEEIEL